MISNRHWFALEPVVLPLPWNKKLESAKELELRGNWSLAGETYGELYSDIQAQPVDPVTKARVAARAGACFEIAQSHTTSARLYDLAAQAIAAVGSNPHLVAELSNRAAIQYRASSENFSAGTAWVRAAEQFCVIPATVINCTENVGALPIAALKSHLCGACFEAAAAAYEHASGNEMWSVMAYWRAGRAYSEGPPNIQAFDAYRKALIAHIKYYGTLEAEQLRLSLPLSTAERTSQLDQIGIMEAALARCNNHHQQTPGETFESRLKTNRQMASTFHTFTLEMQAIANPKEAARFRTEQADRQRKILASEKKYGGALLYGAWNLASHYGESLGRWTTTCILVVLIFAAAYAITGAVASSGTLPDKSLHLFDYIYFSVITFSTLGYGDLHPTGAIGQTLACLEVFSGLTMFGVLLSFILNRVNATK